MPRSKKAQKQAPAKEETDDVVMLDENDELPELIEADETVDMSEDVPKPSETKPVNEDPDAGMTIVKNRKRRAKNPDVFMEDVEEKQSIPLNAEPVIKVAMTEDQFEAKQEAALKAHGTGLQFKRL